MMTPKPISNLELAFPAKVGHLMPLDHEKWPEYRKNWHRNETWAQKLTNAAFYHGLKDLKLQPKDGVDANAAWRHIRAIMGSFEPKHEDKEAACALLLEEWFHGATWKETTKE